MVSQDSLDWVSRRLQHLIQYLILVIEHDSDLGDFDHGMESNIPQDDLVTSDQQTLQNNDDMEVEQLRQRIDTVGISACKNNSSMNYFTHGVARRVCNVDPKSGAAMARGRHARTASPGHQFASTLTFRSVGVQGRGLFPSHKYKHATCSY